MQLVGPEPTRFGLGGRHLSPFVGRELELRFLLERLERAARIGAALPRVG